MKYPFQADSHAQQITVRSAVNASLWACGVISIPVFSAASITNDLFLRIAFFVVGLLPILSFLVSYLYFVFTKPEYLRSEEYQIKVESLRLLGDKDNPLQANASDVVNMINNPALPSPKQANIHE